MLYLFKFASRQTSALSSIISNIFWSDLYHLGLSNDPIYRKALVYGVYAAELVQTILYSKMGYQEYAAGFGDIVALDEIGLLWFAAPVLTALGVYNPYLQVMPLLLTKYFFFKSIVCRSNILCIQNQSIHSIIHRSIPCRFGIVFFFIPS